MRFSGATTKLIDIDVDVDVEVDVDVDAECRMRMPKSMSTEFEIIAPTRRRRMPHKFWNNVAS